MNEGKIITGLVALDWVFNEGRVTKFLVEKGIELYKISKIGTQKTEYLTEKDLVDAGFGC